MGRYGIGTRVAMVVIGTIWLVVGAVWTVSLLRSSSGGPIDGDLDWVGSVATSVAVCGFLLIKTGVTRDRPKTFEEEIPDEQPDTDTGHD